MEPQVWAILTNISELFQMKIVVSVPVNIFPCCGQVKQEVGVLVATQMGFCVVGVFLNNVAFITLKELPSMRASTYNILLCHIVLGTRAALLLFTSKWWN